MTDEELWFECRRVHKELAQVLSERANMRRHKVFNARRDADLFANQQQLESQLAIIGPKLRIKTPPLTHDAMGHDMPDLPEIIEEI